MGLQLQSTNTPRSRKRNFLTHHDRSIREHVKDEIMEIQKRNPRFKPGLAIVQVGERPDSTTYVRMKGKAAQEVGSRYSSFPITLYWCLVCRPTFSSLTRYFLNPSRNKRYVGFYRLSNRWLLSSCFQRSSIWMLTLPCTEFSSSCLYQNTFSNQPSLQLYRLSRTLTVFRQSMLESSQNVEGTLTLYLVLQKGSCFFWKNPK